MPKRGVQTSGHCMLMDGVGVQYRPADDSTRGEQMRVIDFDDPTNND